VGIVLAAVFAPLITPYDPIGMVPGNRFLRPSFGHPMGTDVFGRDILTRVVFGARLSLLMGFVAVTIAGSLGTLVGLIAGYWSGVVDRVATLLIDIMLAFPGVLLALTIAAMLGPGFLNAVLAVGLAGIPQFMRVVRGSVLAVKEHAYVEAASAVGCRPSQIMFRHVLPNIVSPIIVLASIGIGNAILVGSAISFLGLGAKPPVPEWGVMVSDGRNYLRIAWWVATFPGLCIMLTVVSANIIGDALRAAVDPQTRR